MKKQQKLCAEKTTREKERTHMRKHKSACNSASDETGWTSVFENNCFIKISCMTYIFPMLRRKLKFEMDKTLWYICFQSCSTSIVFKKPQFWSFSFLTENQRGMVDWNPFPLPPGWISDSPCLFRRGPFLFRRGELEPLASSALVNIGFTKAYLIFLHEALRDTPKKLCRID